MIYLRGDDRPRQEVRRVMRRTIAGLAVIIAGIVVLVKHSVALAFSLGGIVAAVRFRTTLDDTKDAANIFVVTGVGMAAAVMPPVAWILSGGYNLLAIWLWMSDFGRMPAAHIPLSVAIDSPSRPGSRARKSGIVGLIE